MKTYSPIEFMKKNHNIKVPVVATASSIVFMNVLSPIVPIYAATTEAMKTAESFILSKIISGQYDIDISKYELTVSQAQSVATNVLAMHPELFYMKQSYATFTNSSGNASRLTFETDFTETEITKMSKKYYDELSAAKSFIDPNMSDVEKVMAINQYLSTTIIYSHAECENNAYGALVDRKTMCNGYALAAKALLDYCEIENSCQLSKNYDHIWNLVKIDGKWYNLDITFNDTSTPASGSIMGMFNYLYLLASDDALEENGSLRDEEADITCTSTTYDNAFWRDVGSNMCYSTKTNQWYYTKSNGSGGYGIYSVNFIGNTPGQPQLIKTISGSYQPALAAYNGEIYYSPDGKIVNKLDESTNNPIKVWELPEELESSGLIYALASYDGKLYYSVKTSLSASDANKNYIDSFIETSEFPFSGSGTESDPYIVSNVGHLISLSQLVADGNNFSGKYFKMTSNITVPSGTVLNPIGNRHLSESAQTSTPFSGIFDGNGYSIVSAQMAKQDNKDCVALFGCIEDATIKNLCLDNISCKGSSTYNASLVGYAINSTIKNILINNPDLSSIASLSTDSTYKNIFIYKDTAGAAFTGTGNTFTQCYFGYNTKPSTGVSSTDFTYVPKSEIVSSGLIWQLQTSNTDESAVNWSCNEYTYLPILNFGKNIYRVTFKDSNNIKLHDDVFYCQDAFFSSPIISDDSVYTWADASSRTYTSDTPITCDVDLVGTATSIMPGSGSNSDPYIISDPTSLALLAKKTSEGAFSSSDCFKLNNDIDISGYNISIGSASAPFKGMFIGSNHTITNNNSSLPLFGEIDLGASILQLNVKAKESTAPSIICGTNKGVMLLCKVVQASSLVLPEDYSEDNTNFGAIAAKNNGGLILNCVNSGLIDTSNKESINVGGLVGNNTGTIVNSLFDGTLIGNSNSNLGVGGLIGYNNIDDLADSAFPAFFNNLSIGTITNGAILVGNESTSNIPNYKNLFYTASGDCPAYNDNTYLAAAIPDSVKEISSSDLSSGKALYELNTAFMNEPEENQEVIFSAGDTPWSLNNDKITPDSVFPINCKAIFNVGDSYSKDVYSNSAQFILPNATVMGAENGCSISSWSYGDSSSVDASTYYVTDIADGTIFTAVTSDAPSTISIKDCKIGQIPAQTYTGNALKPSVEISYNGVNLVENQDYTLQYSNNINASTNTALVTIKGIGNYSGSTNIIFDILPCPITSMDFPTATNEISYGSTIGSITLSKTSNQYGTFSWVSPSTVPKASSTASAEVKFTPTATTSNNYDFSSLDGYDSTNRTVKQSIPITVNKRDLNVDITVTDFSINHDTGEVELSYNLSCGNICVGDTVNMDNITVSTTAKADSEQNKKYPISASGVTITNEDCYNIIYNITPSELDFYYKDKITNVTVANSPNKTIYNVGDNFDPDGLDLEITYADNTTKMLSDFGEESVNSIFSVLSKIELTEGQNNVQFDFIDPAYNTTWPISIPVTVANDVTPVSITVTTNPKRTTYYVGEQFDPEGITVMLKMSDDSEKDITSLINFPTEKFETAGNKELVISYNSLQTTLPITVKEDTISSIKITQSPIKTEYVEGEDFDSTGISVVACYESGKEEDITDLVQFDVDMTITSDQENKNVTVSYNSFSTNYQIVIRKADSEVVLESIEIESQPTNTSYFEGDTFNPNGLKIMANYSDGSSVDVTEKCNFAPNTLSSTDTYVVASYNSKTVNIPIVVSPIEISSVTLKSSPIKTEYYEGEEFIPDGFSALVTYNNGSSITISDINEFSYNISSPLTTENTSVEFNYQGFIVNVPITVIKQQISSIKIVSQPKTEYTVGDNIDLSSMSVNLNYNNGDTQLVSYSDFKNYGIEVSLGSKTIPNTVSADISGKRFKIKLNDLVATSDAISVSKKSNPLIVVCKDITFGSIPSPTVNGANIEDVTYKYYSDNSFSSPIVPDGLPVGDYYVVAEAKETDLYLKGTSEPVKFSINPHPTTVSVSSPDVAIAGQPFSLIINGIQKDTNTNISVTAPGVTFTNSNNTYTINSVPSNITSLDISISVTSDNYSDYITTRSITVTPPEEKVKESTSVVISEFENKTYGENLELSVHEINSVDGLFKLYIDEKLYDTSSSGNFVVPVSDVNIHNIKVLFVPSNTEKYNESSSETIIQGNKKTLDVYCNNIITYVNSPVENVIVNVSGLVGTDKVISYPTLPSIDISTPNTFVINFNDDIVVDNQDCYSIKYKPVSVEVLDTSSDVPDIPVDPTDPITPTDPVDPIDPDNPDTPTIKTYNVSVYVDGSFYKTILYKDGDTLTLPNLIPSYGDRFEGWYFDSNYSRPFDFSYIIDDDLSVYAKISDELPNEPDTPSTPEDPIPDTPDTPDNPSEPDNPNQPDVPNNSDKPDNILNNIVIKKWESVLNNPNEYRNGLEANQSDLLYIPEEVVEELRKLNIPITINNGLITVSFKSSSLPVVLSPIEFDVRKASLVSSSAIANIINTKEKTTKEYQISDDLISIKANISFDIGQKYKNQKVDVYYFDETNQLLKYYDTVSASNTGVVDVDVSKLEGTSLILALDKESSSSSNGSNTTNSGSNGSGSFLPSNKTSNTTDSTSNTTDNFSSNLVFYDLSVGEGTKEGSEELNPVIKRNFVIVPLSIVVGLITSLIIKIKNKK